MEAAINIIPFLILFIFLTSYKGFKDKEYFQNYYLHVDKIISEKQYYRLISVGFLHLNWIHLIFNMYTLFVFGEALIDQIGIVKFLILYFISLLGSSLVSLYFHRKHGEYSAVGASGAISGIVFAFIAINPESEIGLILIPIYIKSWIFGLIYIGISILGMRSQQSNIGHDAHLGGALFGLMFISLISPLLVLENYKIVIILILALLVFFIYLIKKPEILLIGSNAKVRNEFSLEHKYNEVKVNKEMEINQLLEKIKLKGYDGLSKKEKERLKELS